MPGKHVEVGALREQALVAGVPQHVDESGRRRARRRHTMDKLAIAEDALREAKSSGDIGADLVDFPPVTGKVGIDLTTGSVTMRDSSQPARMSDIRSTFGS